MILSGNFWKRPLNLKPFVLKIRDGFILGLAQDPQKGSPCSQCVLLWLKTRNLDVEAASLSELSVRRDLISDLLAENQGHVLYEICRDGTAIRMECLIFPHPQCICEKTNFVGPDEITRNTNFAFSPLTQVFCTRFGTPDGNLWLTRVSGETPLTQTPVTVFAVEKEREDSRKKALYEWLKKATLTDLPNRIQRGELIASEVFQTGEYELMRRSESPGASLGAVGAGENREEATLNALVDLAKITTLRRYSDSMKNPMLVVGANQLIRSKTPFFLLKQYDLHILFYPNSTQAWVLGMGAFSRQRSDEKPVFVFSAHTDVKHALDQLFCKILEALKPEEQMAGDPVLRRDPGASIPSQMNMWWTHWIYRCPKISLKDIEQLEPYPRDLENWRNYYRDGQSDVSVLSVNHSTLPSQIRTLVKVQIPLRERIHNVRNINGIGIWSDFRDALA